MFERYSMIVLYFSVLMLLGYLASRRIHSMNDFVIGGKSLSFWVAAFSAQATGEFLGVAAAWFLMATRFKRLSDKYDSMTVIDFMVSRFKPKTHFLRMMSAVVLTIFVLIYISAQIDATGSAFETFL